MCAKIWSWQTSALKVVLSFFYFLSANRGPVPIRLERRVRPLCRVKSCLPCPLFCFTVFSSSHFLWLIILWYAMARTLAPSETNKQGSGGIFKRPGLLVFVCSAAIHSLNAHCLFTASLYIRLCHTVKRKFEHDSEKKEVWFLPLHLQGDLRHPVKLSWKARGDRATLQKADLDYSKGTLI